MTYTPRGERSFRIKGTAYMLSRASHALLLTTPTAPHNKCTVLQLLENTFLKNDLVDTMNFLEDLSIKDPSEKNKFFRSLPSLMPSFPEVVCTRKLLPLISSALSYGGAPALALGCLLQVRG